jgi:hypothetical protein
MFHVSHIHTRWFILNLDPPTNSTSFITIVNGERNHIIPLCYMNQLKMDNVYTLTIRKRPIKNSIWYRSIQITVSEGIIIAELIIILAEFIMKYHRSTGLLSIEKSTNSISFSDTIYPIA